MKQISDGNINLTQPRFFWVAITLAAAIVTLAAIIVVVTFVVSPSPAQAQQTCNGLTATREGTTGDDTINGTNNPDVIALLSGSDESNGLSGDDSICGDQGDDTLSGGGGSDTLLGDGAVFEDFSMGHAFQWWDGGDVEQQLAGPISTTASEHGSGSDTLNGGAGADTLVGGAGADLLTGGVGADRFAFYSLSDSEVGATDLILDFSGTSVNTPARAPRSITRPGEGDVIDLSGIDAIASTAEDDAFSLVTGGFTGVAGQAFVRQQGGNTFLDLDVNGDAFADMTIGFAGPAHLVAADFVL